MDKNTRYKRVDKVLCINPWVRKQQPTQVQIQSFDSGVAGFIFKLEPNHKGDKIDLTGATIIITSMIEYKDGDEVKTSTIIDDKSSTILDKDTFMYESPVELKGFDGEVSMNISIIMAEKDNVSQHIDVADITYFMRKSTLDDAAVKLPDFVYKGWTEIINGVIDKLADGIELDFVINADDELVIIYTFDGEIVKEVNMGNVRGPQGEQGKAATITVGTVTTGDNVSVTNSGTPEEAVFDFVLPEGGSGGLQPTSDYEVVSVVTFGNFQDNGLILYNDGLVVAVSVRALSADFVNNPIVTGGVTYDAAIDFDGEFATAHISEPKQVKFKLDESTGLYKGLFEIKINESDPEMGDDSPIPDTFAKSTVNFVFVALGKTIASDKVNMVIYPTNNAYRSNLMPYIDEYFDLSNGGNQGEPGKAATITIGDVTEGEYMEVINMGTETDAVLDFTLMRGLPGEDGVEGLSAYQVAVSQGFVGSEDEWLESLVGPKGDPADSQIATNTTVGVVKPDGKTITVSTDGVITAESQFPEGGSSGDYLALQGNDGLPEWRSPMTLPLVVAGTNERNSVLSPKLLKAGVEAHAPVKEAPVDGKLYGRKDSRWNEIVVTKGDTGPKGEQGKSAYQVAVEEGYTGTADEWLLSLTGPQGPKGDPAEAVINLTPITTDISFKAALTTPNIGGGSFTINLEFDPNNDATDIIYTSDVMILYNDGLGPLKLTSASSLTNVNTPAIDKPLKRLPSNKRNMYTTLVTGSATYSLSSNRVNLYEKAVMLYVLIDIKGVRYECYATPSGLSYANRVYAGGIKTDDVTFTVDPTTGVATAHTQTLMPRGGIMWVDSLASPLPAGSDAYTIAYTTIATVPSDITITSILNLQTNGAFHRDTSLATITNNNGNLQIVLKEGMVGSMGGRWDYLITLTVKGLAITVPLYVYSR